MAMFTSLAFGAPLGVTLYASGGFIAVAVMTMVLPLLAVLTVAWLPSIPAQQGSPTGLMIILSKVWLPGIGDAFSTVGFGAMIAFSSLLSTERAWSPVWLTFNAFAAALVATRLFFGHAPDKMGGARVAFTCAFIEAAGLAMIWFASGAFMAAAGAALTGIGYSLIYPGFGVEAVQCTSLKSRGLAIGAYTVFLDAALGDRQSRTWIARRLERSWGSIHRQRNCRSVRGSCRLNNPSASSREGARNLRT